MKLSSNITFRFTLMLLNNTGGSPCFFSQAAGERFFFGLPAILYNHNFTLKPRIAVLGLGRVSPFRSVVSAFFFFLLRSGPEIFTSAPVYKVSPAGKYLVLLQLAAVKKTKPDRI